MEYMSPGSSLDFEFDCASFLASGETLSSATWTGETGLTVGTPTDTTTTSTAQVDAASSGYTGKALKLEVEVGTSESNTFSRTWFIKVQEQTI